MYKRDYCPELWCNVSDKLGEMPVETALTSLLDAANDYLVSLANFTSIQVDEFFQSESFYWGEEDDHVNDTDESYV